MVKTGTVLPSRRFGLVRRFSAKGVFVLASVKVANTGTEPLSSLRPNLVIDGKSLQGPVAASRAAAAAASSPDPLNYLALEAPMGGWKSSGLGTRQGADGIRKYTRKQVSVITR